RATDSHDAAVNDRWRSRWVLSAPAADAPDQAARPPPDLIGRDHDVDSRHGFRRADLYALCLIRAGNAWMVGLRRAEAERRGATGDSHGRRADRSRVRSVRQRDEDERRATSRR